LESLYTCFEIDEDFLGEGDLDDVGSLVQDIDFMLYLLAVLF